jgi:hypothetical protein
MQQQGKHLCFYSNKCPWSKAFLTELKTTPWLDQFSFVCVDPSPNRPKLPAWLQKVPSLMIQGENQPRTDADVMNWLSEMKLRSSGSSPSGLQAMGGEPEAWISSEHTSFAKGFGYSFSDSDTSTNGMGGNTIPGAFAFLGGGAAPSAGQPSMMDVKQKSKKEQMFDAQMEEYKRNRDLGLPPGPARV